MDTPEIPVPGLTTFTLPDGRTFSLDVLTAYYDLQDLAQPILAKQGTHLEYLRDVVLYFREKCGVDLTLGQADWLNDQVTVLREQKKSAQLAALKDALSLASSTISPASD